MSSNSTTEKKAKKGRQIAVAAMVLVLGAALFLNWYFNSGISLAASKKTTTENLGQAQYVNATTAAGDYFKETKLKREKTRDNTMNELNKVIDNEKSTSDEKKKAVDTYSKLSERATLETDIETLITAKGVTQCIVVLGDKTCEVVVPQGQLTDTLALQIKEIVNNKANVEADKITVTTAK